MIRQILIDCDPGFDDSLAIIAAHKIKDIDIIGLTVTAGNASLKNTSKNALNLLGELNWDIPIALGASEPLVRKRELSDEKTGIGNIKLKASTNTFYFKDAVDFIYESAKKCKGELEILALAPMTNIAMALTKYPDLKDMIKAVTFMGGTTNEGNIRPWAEFNIYIDPDAADMVIKSGIPITMIGLNITTNMVLKFEDINYFKSLKTVHGNLTGELLKALQDRECFLEKDSIASHDLGALYSMIYPENIKTRKFNVLIEKNDEKRGMLIFDNGNILDEEQNVKVGIGIDDNKFRKWIKDLIGI